MEQLAAANTLLYCPELHDVHTVELAWLANCPAAQLEHGAVADAVYFPAGQEMHADWFTAIVY